VGGDGPQRTGGPVSPPELAAQLTGFAHRLRAAGVAADTSRIITCARALAEFQPLGSEEMYWAARLAFCSRRSDLELFDAAFRAWLEGEPAAEDGPHGEVTVGSAATAVTDDGTPAGPADPAGVFVPGRQEQLTRRDLAELSPADRAEVNALIALLTPGGQPRRSIRHEAGGHRQLDRGRTLRAVLRNSGELAYLERRRPVRKPGRLVLLLDVSGSMGGYSDALLRFAHAAVRARPATTEVFTLATRLTRITRHLLAADPQAAISEVGQVASDWDGGTLLAATLRAFLREWGGRSAVRSAVVVLFSDGWSGDGPDEVAEQAARLSRLAGFLVWGDPDAGGHGYQPSAPGLVRSLSAIDALVPAGSLEALRALAESLPRAGRGAIGWHPLEYRLAG
jgi:uncharacterized protein